jgi:hypothetical protein
MMFDNLVPRNVNPVEGSRAESSVDGDHVILHEKSINDVIEENHDKILDNGHKEDDSDFILDNGDPIIVTKKSLPRFF